jgi:dUTPase
VILINHDLTQSVSFKKGDRIAQLVIQKVERAEFVEVTQFQDPSETLVDLDQLAHEL